MSEIVVVANLKANPGKEDDAREALSGLAETSQSDPGCIFYALHQGNQDRSRFVTVERWESQADLDAHMATDHIAAVLARAEELLAEAPDIVVLDALTLGDPAKGSLAGAAA